VEGCNTRLSIYNPLPTCAVHTPVDLHSLAGAQEVRPLHEPQVRTCAYEACGREFVTTNPARRYCSNGCRLRAFKDRNMESRLRERHKHREVV
jgi:hypothetical protein